MQIEIPAIAVVILNTADTADIGIATGQTKQAVAWGPEF